MAFTPRLNSSGMQGNHIWYLDNPFYQAGYGLPNCTCYSWGRFWEVSDPFGGSSTRPQLPTSNAGKWFERVDTSIYEKSDQLVPQLGAIICFEDDNPDGAGHVANVEEIINDGESIVCSNSAWGGSYFYTTTLYRSNNYKYSHFTFQGFIYHPDYPPGPLPPPEEKKKHNFPWVLYARKLRNQRYL